MSSIGTKIPFPPSKITNRILGGINMLKKFIALTVICTALLIIATPTMAMLKVLDSAVAEELNDIAIKHLAVTYNVKSESITIIEGWVREFWNVKVDVYMIEAIIDKGLATEKKVQVPVRVDQKVVLNEAELAVLDENDKNLASSDPQIRIMTATDLTGESAKDEQKTNVVYYMVAAVVLAGLASIAGFKILRHKVK